jgi:tripartite-type tricarboxylate transporter receptor subunit TctC
VMFATAATAMANMKSGRIKPLMVATPQRIAALPDVPTAREAGFPGFEVASTYAVLAPAGTPPAVVRRLNQEIAKIMQVPEVRQRFQTLGIETMASTPEEAGVRVNAELVKWGQVIKAANIKAD